MKNENLHARLNTVKKFVDDRKKPDRCSDLPSRYRRLAALCGGELVKNEIGTYCLIRTVYPFGRRFGDHLLEPLEEGVSIPRACFTPELSEGNIIPRDLLFFDIETTGLGGTGAVPFLIGFGSLTSDGFEVRQYLMPDYPDERAVLEDLISELKHDRTLVSYNGIAFDLNLVRDRFILNRVSYDLDVKWHADLLHSVRRLFKRRLGDCSLTNVERELLGFYREDDIPGYLVPSVYFGWLSEERFGDMERVLEHNRLDIFALYFLLIYVASIFGSEGQVLCDSDDIYSLSRLYGRRKLNDKVVVLLEGIDCSRNDAIQSDILLFRAQALKRAGRWQAAVALWEIVCQEESKMGYLARVELAKYFEHRAGDISTAYRYASDAGRICPHGATHRMQLQKRLNRLQAKLDRA